MTLTIGDRLGPYEIRAALGAGGMGEVYRGRDSELDRDVALKVLPELFAVDPDRLKGFKREAQVLASLNHPNIAAIYGLVEIPGGRALVLELVEGPTLADRIVAGPIPESRAEVGGNGDGFETEERGPRREIDNVTFKRTKSRAVPAKKPRAERPVKRENRPAPTP